MNVSDLILIILIVLVFGLLLASYVKKFTAKKSCCGTELVRIRKKKLKRTAGSITLQVEGMHCENCRKVVMEAVNSVEGHSAKVDLLAKECKVAFETEPNTAEIIKRIREAGFDASLR